MLSWCGRGTGTCDSTLLVQSPVIFFMTQRDGISYTLPLTSQSLYSCSWTYIAIKRNVYCHMARITLSSKGFDKFSINSIVSFCSVYIMDSGGTPVHISPFDWIRDPAIINYSVHFWCKMWHVHNMICVIKAVLIKLVAL